MVSYTRSRAENTIPSCKVGFMERPERVVLVIIGALFDRMAAVLWVIAVLSNLTVVHRMIFTWREAKHLEEAQGGGRSAGAGGGGRPPGGGAVRERGDGAAAPFRPAGETVKR
jgi:hypothetical protein